jgi:hypothetical protein
MSSANISLPVPVSPVSSTLIDPAAREVTMSSRRTIAGSAITHSS